jgi:hypothetical protein
VIISHRHRYLFVETPHTGSTATSKELVANYAGEQILTKHASYGEFRRIATADQLTYFTFAGMRNPMDAFVTIFYRIATDHKGRYSQPRPAVKVNPHYRAEVEEFEWNRAAGAQFPAWFLRSAWLPYDDWMTSDRRHFGAVIRFENLQADFGAVLRQIGVEQVRPLPLVNVTEIRQPAFADYYPPATRSRAASVFGPSMERCGYSFPAQWGEVKVPRRARLIFRLMMPVRAYARVYRTGLRARMVNALRSVLYAAVRLRRRVRPAPAAER